MKSWARTRAQSIAGARAHCGAKVGSVWSPVEAQSDTLVIQGLVYGSLRGSVLDSWLMGLSQGSGLNLLLLLGSSLGLGLRLSLWRGSGLGRGVLSPLTRVTFLSAGAQDPTARDGVS